MQQQQQMLQQQQQQQLGQYMVDEKRRKEAESERGRAANRPAVVKEAADRGRQEVLQTGLLHQLAEAEERKAKTEARRKAEESKSAERAKNVLIAEKDEKEKAEKDENEAEEQDDLMRTRALSILRTRAGEENAEISEEIAQAHPDPASMGMGNIKERNIKLAW